MLSPHANHVEAAATDFEQMQLAMQTRELRLLLYDIGRANANLPAGRFSSNTNVP